MGAAAAWRRWISPRRSEPSNRSALDTAVRYLARRPRSEYEVRQHLRRARIDDATIDAVVGQLRRHRLLDDTAFAAYWVEQRRTFRPRGPRLLRAELSRLGVSRVDSDGATAELLPDEDAYRAAAKRALRLRELDESTFTARLSAFLARRGFDWETVAAVVRRLWSERSEQSAETAIRRR